MNILDENFPQDQADVLRARGVHVRQIGSDIGRAGMLDHEILVLLHSLKRSTFISLDVDFSDPSWRHPSYGIVFLYVRRPGAAEYVRRVLRHPAVNTQAKRMGAYVRASYDGIRDLAAQ